MTMTVFEYLILFTIDFFTIFFLRFLLSFGFDGEDISNTQDSVSLHFLTSRNSSKNTRLRVVFLTLFSLF